jgi:pimeloyl-ACP methyl ester carboxylesterase
MVCMRWLRIGGVFATALPLTIAASAAHREFRADFRPNRSVPASSPILEDKKPESVAFEARGVTLRGWFIPTSNGAAVLMVHGTDADRSQLTREADMLARRGYGVLLFAFSMGCMIAVQVAARDPRIAALVVEGGFADADDQLRFAFRSWGALSQRPAMWTARWLGLRSDELRPKDVIADIAPRPVFVIAGAEDDIVPPDQTRALFEAAHEPKSWWLVKDAAHGDYAKAAGPEYEERIAKFYEEALILKRESASLRPAAR